MSTDDAPPSWFSALDPESSEWLSPPGTPSRLWHGFLTARLMLALALLMLQGLSNLLNPPINLWGMGLGGVYFGLTLLARWRATMQPPNPEMGTHWLPTLGLDLLVFSGLQWLQTGNMNYAPLIVMPVLMAATLGSRLLTLSSAAAGTLLLLAQTWSLHLLTGNDAAAPLMQAGITGCGYFVVGLLVHQLAQRLAREERISNSSRLAAQVQSQVNILVIEHLRDGVLVIDAREVVCALNPAARVLLGPAAAQAAPGFWLGTHPQWQPLLDLARATFGQALPQVQDTELRLDAQSLAQVHVRTQLTRSGQQGAGKLCVMFVHDLRELEARLRTEKLAAMGRVSAAMAHEIRNPLAAITQANALLEEDVQDPGQRRLVQMVQHNAQRLARIVEEVLDIARVEHQLGADPASAMLLDASVAACCREWCQRDPARRRVQLDLQAGQTRVHFDPEHLRRVLDNLLDNALRYQGPHPDSLQVSTRSRAGQPPSLMVWSDGAPMEPSVERHLFEPFFSSESRSSGLGLYICRQLCERHGAHITYRRTPVATARGSLDGNAFLLNFTTALASDGQPQLAFDTMPS